MMGGRQGSGLPLAKGNESHGSGGRGAPLRRVVGRMLRSSEPGIFLELECGHSRKRRPHKPVKGHTRGGSGASSALGTSHDRLASGVDAVSAFANCGRAVAHVRGSYGPRSRLVCRKGHPKLGSRLPQRGLAERLSRRTRSHSLSANS
jgi:hypothetical protein